MSSAANGALIPEQMPTHTPSNFVTVSHSNSSTNTEHQTMQSFPAPFGQTLSMCVDVTSHHSLQW